MKAASIRIVRLKEQNVLAFIVSKAHCPILDADPYPCFIDWLELWTSL